MSFSLNFYCLSPLFIFFSFPEHFQIFFYILFFLFYFCVLPWDFSRIIFSLSINYSRINNFLSGVTRKILDSLSLSLSLSLTLSLSQERYFHLPSIFKLKSLQKKKFFLNYILISSAFTVFPLSFFFLFFIFFIEFLQLVLGCFLFCFLFFCFFLFYFILSFIFYSTLNYHLSYFLLLRMRVNADMRM